MQAPAYFQELMTCVLKDFSFTIIYLDDIIIFSRMAEEHLSHIKQVFEKLRNAHLSMKLSKCFFTKDFQYLGYILSTKGIRSLPSKTQAINNMHPPKSAKQVCTFLRLIRYYRTFIKNVAKMAKPLTLLTLQKAKFEWTPIHHTAFLMLKESVTQSTYPMLSGSNKMIHSLYRCTRQCMWSTTLTRILWNRISNSLSFVYFHGNTKKMKYQRT